MMPYASQDRWQTADARTGAGAGAAMVAFRWLNWRRASVLMAFTIWGLIAYNALFAQPGPHPAPFFSRGGETAAVATPASRALPSDPAGAVRYEAAPAPAVAPEAGSVMDEAAVRMMQEALYQRGYDVGGVDGRLGPRTRAAILAFERDVGLPGTGEPSPQLMLRLGIDPVAPAPQAQAVPAPQTRTTPQAIAAPRAKSEVEQALDMATRREPEPVHMVPTTAVRIDDLIAGVAPGGADPATIPVPPAPVGDPLVARVQGVLADLGYAPGRIDGFSGPETREAIANFRADRGLPPGDAVTADLVAELSNVTGIAIIR